jgi:hypothetical protein
LIIGGREKTKKALEMLFWLFVLVLSQCLLSAVTFAEGNNAQFDLFWSGFRKSVLSADRDKVSEMVQYPLSMPYGQDAIKDRKDFKKRYGHVFIQKTNECFSNATPEEDDGTMEVSCDNAQVYRFEMINEKYRLTSVDNINE